MYPDVIDLQEFYQRQLGRVTRHMIRRKVVELWPDLGGARVLGLGYATPYLSRFDGTAERVISVMPAAQGVVAWPEDGRNRVALVEEEELPLPDASIDRVLIVHALENSEQARHLLREVWRVMTSGARLLLVVPNRTSLWSRAEGTPFGHGSPFTGPQITRMLRDSMFSPTRKTMALYMPPSEWGLIIGASRALESIGEKFWPTLGGVRIVEASKQIYGLSPLKVARRGRRRVIASSGAPTGAAG